MAANLNPPNKASVEKVNFFEAMDYISDLFSTEIPLPGDAIFVRNDKLEAAGRNNLAKIFSEPQMRNWIDSKGGNAKFPENNIPISDKDFVDANAVVLMVALRCYHFLQTLDKKEKIEKYGARAVELEAYIAKLTADQLKMGEELLSAYDKAIKDFNVYGVDDLVLKLEEEEVNIHPAVAKILAKDLFAVAQSPELREVEKMQATLGLIAQMEARIKKLDIQALDPPNTILPELRNRAAYFQTEFSKLVDKSKAADLSPETKKLIENLILQAEQLGKNIAALSETLIITAEKNAVQMRMGGLANLIKRQAEIISDYEERLGNNKRIEPEAAQNVIDSAKQQIKDAFAELDDLMRAIIISNYFTKEEMGAIQKDIKKLDQDSLTKRITEVAEKITTLGKVEQAIVRMQQILKRAGNIKQDFDIVVARLNSDNDQVRVELKQLNDEAIGLIAEYDALNDQFFEGEKHAKKAQQLNKYRDFMQEHRKEIAGYLNDTRQRRFEIKVNNIYEDLKKLVVLFNDIPENITVADIDQTSTHLKTAAYLLENLRNLRAEYKRMAPTFISSPAKIESYLLLTIDLESDLAQQAIKTHASIARFQSQEKDKFNRLKDELIVAANHFKDRILQNEFSANTDTTLENHAKNLRMDALKRLETLGNNLKAVHKSVYSSEEIAALKADIEQKKQEIEAIKIEPARYELFLSFPMKGFANGEGPNRGTWNKLIAGLTKTEGSQKLTEPQLGFWDIGFWKHMIGGTHKQIIKSPDGTSLMEVTVKTPGWFGEAIVTGVKTLTSSQAALALIAAMQQELTREFSWYKDNEGKSKIILSVGTPENQSLLSTASNLAGEIYHLPAEPQIAQIKVPQPKDPALVPDISALSAEVIQNAAAPKPDTDLPAGPDLVPLTQLKNAKEAKQAAESLTEEAKAKKNQPNKGDDPKQPSSKI